MYCSIEEAWPTYNYTNNPISRSNGVENFLNNKVNEHSIMNKNDIRPQCQTNSQTHNMIHNTSLPEENIIITNKKFDNELTKNHSLYDKHNKFHSCQDFMYHLQNCEECQNLIHSNKPSKIEEILLLNPNIKETIVIFLVGILILIILNLFYK